MFYKKEIHVHVASILLGVILLGPSMATAQAAKPVAIRFWGHALVSIETYWNLRVVIDPYQTKIGYDDPKLSADLVLVTHEHFDHNHVAMIQGKPHVIRGLDKQGLVLAHDLILNRRENADEITLTPYDEKIAYVEHALRVQSIGSQHDLKEGTDRGHNAMFLIETYGLRILHCGDLGQKTLTDAQLNRIGRLDVLIIPVGGVYTIDGQQAVEIINQLEPRFVVPIHFKTEQLTVNLETLDKFLENCPNKYQRVQAVGNTFAVSFIADRAFEKQKLILLKTRPWQMPDSLAKLFDAKEKVAHSVKSSYSQLSITQLNHEPSNGTHTPRWNAEHIMAAELNFFSSIYSHLDPMIRPVDLSPPQTPPEYQPAHPDWTGAEEARQIERVQAFTRRFAYLLDGVKLSETPIGSPWSLKELLERMADHYQHHTDNLSSKFKLPDWPKK